MAYDSMGNWYFDPAVDGGWSDPQLDGGGYDPNAYDPYFDPFNYADPSFDPYGYNSYTQNSYFDPNTGTYYVQDNSGTLQPVSGDTSNWWSGILSSAGGLGNVLGSGLTALGSYLQGRQVVSGANNAMGTLASQQAANEAALAPYILGGVNAWSNLQNMTNSQIPAFHYNPNTYYQSPAYQAMFNQMKNATMAQGSMTGNIGSGNMNTALMNAAAQLGAQYMPLDQQIQQQNYMNSLNANQQDYARMAGLASTGLNALGYQTQLGSNTANMIGNLQNQVGYTNGATTQNMMTPLINTITNYGNH